MTGRIDYRFADPGGNRTLLITSPVPIEERKAVAARLMSENPTAEQAGFISPGRDGADISLDMAGGEFCGNAAMSAAVLFAEKTGADRVDVKVAVSGADAPVNVTVESLSDGARRGTVGMPLPEKTENVLFPDGKVLPTVFFPGIFHCVIVGQPDKSEAEDMIKRYCAYLGAPALGLMFVSEAFDTLTPLVYVPEADTLFWESACGSGSSAVGVLLSRMKGEPVDVALAQPGGELCVRVDALGRVFLSGTVRMLK